MSTPFDAYHLWLGIPPDEQPPNNYRLLGIKVFEGNPDVISDAAEQRMAHVRTKQLSQHVGVSQRILNEIASADVCLLNPDKKAAYDAMLRRELDKKAAGQSGYALIAGEAGGKVPLPPSAPVSPSISWRVMAIAGSGAAALMVLLLAFILSEKRSPEGAKQEASPIAVQKQASGDLPPKVIPQPTKPTPVSEPSPTAEPAKEPPPVQKQAPTDVIPRAAQESPKPRPVSQPNPPPTPAEPIKEQRAKPTEVAQVPVIPTPPVDPSRLLVNSIGMKLVLIAPGEFEMGTTEEDIKWLEEEAARQKSRGAAFVFRVRTESPRHRVVITKPLYMGAFEVTRGEYQQVSGKTAEQDKSQYPVSQVSWDEAVEFCRRLSDTPQELAAKRSYRLPTEAEWEYCCRAGTTTRYCFGDDSAKLGEYASTGKEPQVVGQKKPNVWGLFDMHGNVAEWCADWFGKDYYQSSPLNDPVGPAPEKDRVVRGGSVEGRPLFYRSAMRGWGKPTMGLVGFRVVCVAPSEAPATRPVKPPRGQSLESARRAAEWVLGKGGKLGIRLADTKTSQVVTRAADIPKAAFEVTEIGLPGAQLPSSEFKYLADLRSLESLHLPRSSLDDEGMIYIGRLENLVSLGVVRTKIGDAGLAHIKGLRKLEELNLTKTRVTDKGMTCLKGFRNLKVLGLAGTRVTEAGIVQLKGLRNLREIGLGRIRVSEATVRRLFPNCAIRGTEQK